MLKCFGYTGMIIVVDRVDEPTIVAGDPDRMRAIVWPMLSNKFLQAGWRRHQVALTHGSAPRLDAREQRVLQGEPGDKQRTVEELAWTGPMLYDLCDSRLSSCRVPEAGHLDVLSLFAEDVTRQDILEALDKVRQPREAFKLLYRCMTEHCTKASPRAWQMANQPSHPAKHVTKLEVQRVQRAMRGIRPG